MSQDLVKVASFQNSPEAHAAQNALEQEGIVSCLDGEEMGTWFWYLGSAIGGIKLLVNESDAPRAMEILETAHNPATADDIWSDEDAAADAEPDGPEIPADVLRAWRAAVIGLALCPPVLHLYSMWLLVRGGHLVGRSDRPSNWRVFAAVIVNMLVFLGVAWFFKYGL